MVMLGFANFREGLYKKNFAASENGLIFMSLTNFILNIKNKWRIILTH